MIGMRMTMAKCCMVELARAIKSIASRSGELTLSVSALIFCKPKLI